MGSSKMESTLEKIDFESDEESPLTLSQSAGAKQSFQFETSSHTSVPKFRTLRKLQFTAFHSVYVVLFKAKINVLLPFGPLAVLMHYMTGRHGWVFFFSLLGITPLAERLGYATEQLACYTGNTVGGLLNATFGNATEMIISIYALKNKASRKSTTTTTQPATMAKKGGNKQQAAAAPQQEQKPAPQKQQQKQAAPAPAPAKEAPVQDNKKGGGKKGNKK